MPPARNPFLRTIQCVDGHPYKSHDSPFDRSDSINSGIKTIHCCAIVSQGARSRNSRLPCSTRPRSPTSVWATGAIEHDRHRRRAAELIHIGAALVT